MSLTARDRVAIYLGLAESTDHRSAWTRFSAPGADSGSTLLLLGIAFFGFLTVGALTEVAASTNSVTWRIVCGVVALLGALLVVQRLVLLVAKLRPEKTS